MPLFLLLLVALAVPGVLSGQEGEGLVAGEMLYEIRTAGGESYVGRVVAVQGDTVVLESTSGVRIELARGQIVSARPARGRMVRGQFWREDPNRTRLFFSPTGRSLARGDGYFGVYEVVIPFVAYGVSDRLLLAGGSPFYLAFTGDVTPPVYFGPKFQVVSTPSLAASIGALTVWVPDDGADDDVFGIVYGIGTYGSTDHALTGGLGWGYVQDDFSSKPVVMLGGETRISRSLKLVTENLFVPGEDGAILSGGVRFFGERLSADAGLVGWAGSSAECCFPLVNFVYNFGGR